MNTVLIVATLLAIIGVWAVWSTGAAGRRWRPLLRLAFQVAGQIQRRFVALRAGEPGAVVVSSAHECTVKNRSLTWPS